MAASNRIEVMHGVNLDMLHRRDPGHYGDLGLLELEQLIAGFAGELGLSTRFFQSNSEGEFVQRMHQLDGQADGVIVNAGAWSHYSWAIRDALELTRLPAVEVHLSDVEKRDPWRKISVFDGLCIEKIFGKGPEGYRLALQRLQKALQDASGG
ncbi:MAG: type II 3-dehydroquinate dehydratase [Solirubrobacteraceae bacterium]